jgi:hypothetical protein
MITAATAFDEGRARQVPAGGNDATTPGWHRTLRMICLDDRTVAGGHHPPNCSNIPNAYAAISRKPRAQRPLGPAAPTHEVVFRRCGLHETGFYH